MPTKRIRKNNYLSKKKKQLSLDDNNHDVSSQTGPRNDSTTRSKVIDVINNVIPSSSSTTTKNFKATSNVVSSIVTFVMGVLLASIYFRFIVGPQQTLQVDGKEVPTRIGIGTSSDKSKNVHPTSNAHKNNMIDSDERIVIQSHAIHTLSNSSSINSPESRSNPKSASKCNLYVAKSSIPNAGLGVFTTKGISQNEHIEPADIVIQIPDINPHYYPSIRVLSFDYLWDGQDTGGQYEGRKVHSLIPGIGALSNGHPYKYNTIQSHGSFVDNGGLFRSSHPAAGSSSSYFNYKFIASQDIPPGGEILVHYGMEWFNERVGKQMISPISSSSLQSQENNKNVGDDNDNQQQNLYIRSLKWLEENGSCLDNIQVKQSTNAHAGRGAFATRYIKKGEVVAPAPVIQINDRKSMEMLKVKSDPIKGDVVERSHQLLLNYCFGHVNSTILLYPIAPIVNYINHDSTQTNVELRWSTSTQHDIKYPHNMTIEDLKEMKHAGLMLEFFAIKDIQPDDEIFLNYGHRWEEAWHDHLHRWEPIDAEKEYTQVYADIFNNSTEVIRTAKEQQLSPYPDNFFTSCYYKYEARKNDQSPERWKETKTVFHDENLRPCMILDRYINNQKDGKVEQLYTVGIQNRFGLHDSQRIPNGKPHVVSHVPRHAIRFSSKLYTSDQHLKDAFRHEINVPEGVYPHNWLDLQ